MQVLLKNISRYYTKVVQRLRTTLSFAQYFLVLFIRLILCRLHNFQLFGFSFKIRIIFVKLLCSYFFDFAILFYQVRVKAWDSLLGVTGFPYCRLIQSQLCALRAPGFWGGKRNARFAWTQFKISVIFVKLLRHIFYIWLTMHSALYYHLEHGNASRCILCLFCLLASNASGGTDG